MNAKAMRLVDPSTGGMECKSCGAFHFASISRGGRYRSGSWQCPNGCSAQEKAANSTRRANFARAKD